LLIDPIPRRETRSGLHFLQVECCSLLLDSPFDLLHKLTFINLSAVLFVVFTFYHDYRYILSLLVCLTLQLFGIGSHCFCYIAELQGIDRTILNRALKLLEQKGKLVVFKGTSTDDEGIKFSV
jgi:hypothetical protein